MEEFLVVSAKKAEATPQDSRATSTLPHFWLNHVETKACTVPTHRSTGPPARRCASPPSRCVRTGRLGDRFKPPVGPSAFWFGSPKKQVFVCLFVCLFVCSFVRLLYLNEGSQRCVSCFWKGFRCETHCQRLVPFFPVARGRLGGRVWLHCLS